MRIFLFMAACLLPGICPATSQVAATKQQPGLQAVARSNLCVTNGVLSSLPNGHMEIDTPSSRAVMRISTDQSAEIRFRYLGPSSESKPLASGELRRQIGLKLRAQDSCNLIYAMWHIEPDSKFGVSIKRNIGKQTHEECHADGYVTIKPRTSADLPRMRPGEAHKLRADLRGEELTLVADGKTVWEGGLGKAIAEFAGPIGLRTDNARFEFEYLAKRGQANRLYERNCQAGPED